MKKIILYTLFGVFWVSCKPTLMVMPTGKIVTEKKIKRVTKRSIRITLRSISKEEKETLRGLKYKVLYDTLKK